MNEEESAIFSMSLEAQTEQLHDSEVPDPENFPSNDPAESQPLPPSIVTTSASEDLLNDSSSPSLSPAVRVPEVIFPNSPSITGNQFNGTSSNKHRPPQRSVHRKKISSNQPSLLTAFLHTRVNSLSSTSSISSSNSFSSLVSTPTNNGRDEQQNQNQLEPGQNLDFNSAPSSSVYTRLQNSDSFSSFSDANLTPRESPLEQQPPQEEDLQPDEIKETIKELVQTSQSLGKQLRKEAITAAMNRAGAAAAASSSSSSSARRSSFTSREQYNPFSSDKSTPPQTMLNSSMDGISNLDLSKTSQDFEPVQKITSDNEDDDENELISHQYHLASLVESEIAAKQAREEKYTPPEGNSSISVQLEPIEKNQKQQPQPTSPEATTTELLRSVKLQISQNMDEIRKDLETSSPNSNGLIEIELDQRHSIDKPDANGNTAASIERALDQRKGLQIVKDVSVSAMLVVRTMMNSSFFALPFAMNQGGIAFVLLLIFIHSFAADYTSKTVSKMASSTSFSSYAGASFSAFNWVGSIFYSVFLLFVGVGTAACSFLAIGSALNDVFPQVHSLFFVLISLIIALPLFWIRNPKHIHWIGLVSLVVFPFALCVASAYGMFGKNQNHNVWNSETNSSAWWERFLFNPKGFFFSYGIVKLSFSGCSEMFCQIRKNMSSEFVFARTIDFSVLIVATGVSLMSLLGFICFGESTRQSILMNLGRGPYELVVSLIICVLIAISIPFTLLTCSDHIENFVKRLLPAASSRSIKVQVMISWIPHSLIRTLLVFAGAALAIIFSNYFAILVSLVGAFGDNFLGTIFPALLYLRLQKNLNSKPLEVVKSLGLLALGLFGVLMGFLVLIF